ncbi:hypothetical protein VPHK469_0104 [Vibrio phage K469]
MIKLNKVSDEAPRIINPVDCLHSIWYPIHNRDVKGDLIGFAQYLGDREFCVALGDAPVVMSTGQLTATNIDYGRTIADKPTDVKISILTQSINSKSFDSLDIHSMFECGVDSDTQTFMKISNTHAIIVPDGTVIAFKKKMNVVVVDRIGEHIQIDYEG